MAKASPGRGGSVDGPTISGEGFYGPTVSGGGSYGALPRRRRGHGLRVRFSRIGGETPKHVLAHGPLWLPATLGDWSFSEEALDFRDYMTIGEGEFTQAPGGDGEARKLRTTSMEALTVRWDAEWLVEHNGRSPHDVYEDLRKIIRSHAPVEMLVSLSLAHRPELRMDVTLRSFERELRHGQPGIRYYTLDWKEWRGARARRRTHSPEESRHRGKKLPTKHPINEGTTLHRLSRLYYGTEVAWRTIAQANGIKGWGPDSFLYKMGRYKVGDEIKIPKKPPLVSTPETRTGIPGRGRGGGGPR